MKVGIGVGTFVWRKILNVSAAVKPLAITAPVMEYVRIIVIKFFTPMLLVTPPVNTPVAAATATGAGTSVLRKNLIVYAVAKQLTIGTPNITAAFSQGNTAPWKAVRLFAPLVTLFTNPNPVMESAKRISTLIGLKLLVS